MITQPITPELLLNIRLLESGLLKTIPRKKGSRQELVLNVLLTGLVCGYQAGSIPMGIIHELVQLYTDSSGQDAPTMNEQTKGR